jgi:S1-C subfamily serine protease
MFSNSRTISFFICLTLMGLWVTMTFADDLTNIPVAAPIDSDSAGRGGAVAVQSVLRIICIQQNSAGTGFLHKSGNILTADHVVRGCPKPIIALPNGTQVEATIMAADQDYDLALLKPNTPVTAPPLPISEKNDLTIGTQVSTWGFPGGYFGVTPMLSVGYLAGIDGLKTATGKIIRQWVVNAASRAGLANLNRTLSGISA